MHLDQILTVIFMHTMWFIDDEEEEDAVIINIIGTDYVAIIPTEQNSK